MASPDLEQPPLIVVMNTLLMPVGEITSEMTRLVDQVSYFSFNPHPDTVFSSNQYDVAVQTSDHGMSISVAEPECGRRDLSIIPRRDNRSLRQEITWLCTATRERKKILFHVINILCKLSPGFPTPSKSVRFKELADACDLHITTVARALQDKVCLTPFGPVACREFIYDLR